MRLIFFSLYILFAFSSCRSRSIKESYTPASHPDSVFVSIERSPCFGRCPSYYAAIYNNGSAVYEGRSSAVRQGLFRGKALSGQIKMLGGKALSLRLDTLQHEYVNPRLADFPSHRFSVLLNGELKRVYIMHTDPPGVVTEFESLLESELEKIEWKKVEQER